MDFAQSALTGLSETTSQEKIRFTGLLHRLLALSKLARRQRLIATTADRLILTADPLEILTHTNFHHPVVSLLTTHLSKLPAGSPAGSYALALIEAFVNEILGLFEYNESPRAIARELNALAVSEEIEKAFQSLCAASAPLNNADALHAFTAARITNRHIARLLANSILEINKNAPSQKDSLHSDDSKTPTEAGNTGLSFPQTALPEKIRVFKLPGAVLEDSYAMEGLVFPRKPLGTITDLEETAISVFSCPLEIPRTEMKGTLLFNNSEALLNFSRSETAQIHALVNSLASNILVCSGNVDDQFLEFASARNIAVVRVPSKYDLARVAVLTGTKVLPALSHGCLAQPRETGGAESAEQGSGEALKSSPAFVKPGRASLRTNTHGGHDLTTLTSTRSSLVTLVVRHTLPAVMDGVEREVVSCLEVLAGHAGAVVNCEEAVVVLARLFEGRGVPVLKVLGGALRGVEMPVMLVSEARQALLMVVGFLGGLLEISDFLVAKRDVLDVKPPQGGHWDND